MTEMMPPSIGRRQALAGLAAAPWATVARAAPLPVVAGAIRWDAWYAASGAPLAAQNTLGYSPWQTRAPWFAKRDGPHHITAIGTQENMDVECRLAGQAGLSYWAFDMYAVNSPMSVAWHLYQASPYRHLVNWCGIIGPGFLGNDPFGQSSLWMAKDDIWLEHFAQPNYQKVEGDRPLLYILWSEAEIRAYFSGDIRNFGVSLRYLRARCAAAGLGNPYIVIMAGRAETSALILRQTGADAISNYIPVTGKPPVGATPWNVLDARTQAFWVSLASQGVECIPIVTTGWDTRARREHPEPIARHEFNNEPLGYFMLPTDAQLRAEMQAAGEFVRANPHTCASKALLIYSWDECDEGGNPLIPTLGRPPGKSLIEAVAPSL